MLRFKTWYEALHNLISAARVRMDGTLRTLLCYWVDLLLMVWTKYSSSVAYMLMTETAAHISWPARNAALMPSTVTERTE